MVIFLPTQQLKNDESVQKTEEMKPRGSWCAKQLIGQPKDYKGECSIDDISS